MRQAKRQHFIVTYAISLGLMIALLSLFQSIPSASAQQLIGPVSQETSGTGTQGRRIENIVPTLPYPTKSLEKKDAQTSTRTSHRLIRKSQSALTATLQPIPLDTSKSTSSTAVPTSALNDTTTQSKDTSVSSKIGAMAAPAITPLGLMSTAAVTTSTTVTPNTTAPHSLLSGTTAYAGAVTANASTGASTPPAGRSMSRLASEMPGLAQLIDPASSSSSPPPPAPVPPAIGASPTSLSFAATQGGANPAAQVLSISNTGGGTLSWSANDSAPWLTLSPASGTGNGTVTLTAATGTLTTGSYSGTVTMSATGASPVTVPVTFTVTAPVRTPAIGLSPTTFSFTATQGAANPAPNTLNVTNPGTGTLTWSVTDNANWLTLTPASGTTTTGTSPVTLSLNTAGLLAGPFTAAITVTATTATNSPQTIPVTLTVSAPTTSTAALSWNANTELDLAGYKVYQATASGGYPLTPIATLPKTVLTYTAMGLQMGTTYYFTLTAYDLAGNESPKSNEVSKSIF
jgi:hypothetical protein